MVGKAQQDQLTIEFSLGERAIVIKQGADVVDHPETLPVLCIRRRHRFERSPEPISVPEFTTDMLVIDDDDPIVFKRCECGAVWAYNTDAAYHHTLTVCACGKRQFARDLHWAFTQIMVSGDLAFDWNDYQWKRLEVTE